MNKEAQKEPKAPGRTFAFHQAQRVHPQDQNADSAYCPHLTSVSMNWQGEAKTGDWNTNTDSEKWAGVGVYRQEKLAQWFT